MRRLGPCLAALAALATLTSSATARAQEPGPLPPLPAPTPRYAPSAPPPPPPYAPGPPNVPGPGAPPPSPAFTPRGAPGGGEATIQFDPAEPDLTLLARNGEHLVVGLQRFRHSWWTTTGIAYHYAPICAGPCVTRLPVGEYNLALGKGRGHAAIAGPTPILGPSALHAEYTDRSGLRTAGTVIGIVGVLGGVGLVVASFAGSETVCDAYGDCYDRSRVNGMMMGGGVALIVTSAIVGSVLALQHDEARIVVTPLAVSPTGAARESPLGAIGAATTQGASIGVRF